MANPRKFSEKIALHNQKQAEETAAFERIMQEVSVTRVIGGQPQPSNANHLQPQGYLRPYLGGSLPNVNQIAANPHMSFHLPQGGFDDGKHLMRHPARLDARMRPYGFNHRRPLPLEFNRNRPTPIDGHPNQYASSYLSPPSESNWRRTNSDSALHKSVMNPVAQQHFDQPSFNNQGRHDALENNHTNTPPLYKPTLEPEKMDTHMQTANRPKSTETASMSHLPSESGMRQGTDPAMAYHSNGTASNFPTAMAPGVSQSQIGNNTGSLPDLTNLHIPSPLIKPIDYDDMPSPSQQSGAQSTTIYNQGRTPSGQIAGMSCGSASPNRGRRTAQNGPSPLSLSSPDHTRRLKFPANSVQNQAVTQSEVKSPPIVGSYQQAGLPGGGWPLTSSDHPGSPVYGQSMASHGMKQADFATLNNPTLSEASYPSEMQPLQHKFEQFHVVSDANVQRSRAATSPLYSALATLNENTDGVFDPGQSGLLSYGSQDSHYQRLSSLSKIPDIILTGVDEPQSGKSLDFDGMGGDYFSAAELKANLGLEELQMLDEPNIINAPAIEDSLHLDSI